MISNIQTPRKDYSETRAVIWDIKWLMSEFAFVRVKFVTREGNKATHELMFIGMESSIECFWIEDALKRVMTIVYLDSHF